MEAAAAFFALIGVCAFWATPVAGQGDARTGWKVFAVGAVCFAIAVALAAAFNA